jgi:DNA-binding NtrC family response regulator
MGPSSRSFAADAHGRIMVRTLGEFRKTRPTMPVAVISANHQREVVDRARAMGATFLPKPVTEQALKEFLATAVQLRQGFDP